MKCLKCFSSSVRHQELSDGYVRFCRSCDFVWVIKKKRPLLAEGPFVVEEVPSRLF